MKIFIIFVCSKCIVDFNTENMDKKIIFNSFCLFLLFFVQNATFGQRYVSGSVTDSEDGTTIRNASVFISNTTIGIATDSTGHYHLKIPREGNYVLTISHVGYEPVFMVIEPGDSSLIYDVALHYNKLSELTIAKEVRFRRRDIDLFMRTIFS